MANRADCFMDGLPEIFRKITRKPLTLGKAGGIIFKLSG